MHQDTFTHLECHLSSGAAAMGVTVEQQADFRMRERWYLKNLY